MSAFRLGLGLFLATGAVALVGASGIPYPFEQELWLLWSTGYGALAALGLCLGATPAARMVARLRRSTPRKAAVGAYRRALGMTSAWLALAHAAVAFNTYLANAYWAVVRPYLRAGGVATVLLAILLLTSYPAVVRLLRIRLFRELHRLSYAAALFAFMHLALSPFAPKRATFAGALAFAVFWCTRFLPVRTEHGDFPQRGG